VPARLTVSMPHHRTPDLLARAVESVLGQTFKDLILVVVNDGADPDEAWRPIEHIDDRRLIRFDLEQNSGRYYADAVVLAASDAPLFTVHDSDDWSDRGRFQHLVRVLGGADVAFGGHVRHQANGKVDERLPKIVTPPDPQIRHMTHHTALWRTDALRAIGGPHPDWRIAYDTFLVALAVDRLDWVATDRCDYHHVIRPGSLTSSARTRPNSKARRTAHIRRRSLWRQLAPLPTRQIPDLLRPNPTTARRVATDAARLREILP